MKKIISIMLAIAFVFTLSACGKNNTLSGADSSAPAQTEAFTAPENYASVLLITINPQFKLYLDENNNVLAVEPVNDDAKAFSDEIDFENKSFEAVIETIVKKANEKGFIKENATVNFEITEQKAEAVNKDDILQKAVASADHKANELFIVIVTQTKESTQSTSPEIPYIESSTVNQNNTHTHDFSAATCTEPEKCSCGTVGSPPLGHNYDNGTCTRCLAQDQNFAFTSISEKIGVWRLSEFIGNDDDLYRIVFSLHKENIACPFEAASPLKELPTDIQDYILKEEKETVVIFGNEEFYFNRGSVFDTTINEEKSNIKITSEYGGELVLIRLDENTMTISKSTGNFYRESDGELPIGLKLTFENN